MVFSLELLDTLLLFLFILLVIWEEYEIELDEVEEDDEFVWFKLLFILLIEGETDDVLVLFLFLEEDFSKPKIANSLSILLIESIKSYWIK